MEEIWKPIPGYKGYEASSIGRIRSVDRWRQLSNRRCFYRGKVLALLSHSEGYKSVGLGRERSMLVHVAVALAFLGPRRGREVCHANDVKDDNRLENIRWGTRRSNLLDRVKLGGGNQGVRHWKALLTNADVLAIRASKEKGVVFAKLYGVSAPTISQIRTGRYWRHLESF